MTADRRRAGRAIRKQRRETEEALVAFAAIDWAALVDTIAMAVNKFAEDVAAAVVQVIEVFAALFTPEFTAEYGMPRMVDGRAQMERVTARQSLRE